MGVAPRTSYSAMDRSLAVAPRRYVSAGFHRTLHTLSAPHSNVCSGSDRACSQMSTVVLQVANRRSVQWWSMPLHLRGQPRVTPRTGASRTATRTRVHSGSTYFAGTREVHVDVASTTPSPPSSEVVGAAAVNAHSFTAPSSPQLMNDPPSAVTVNPRT